MQVYNIDGFSIGIDTTDNTAKFCSVSFLYNHVFIPRSIKFRNKEYVITELVRSFKENRHIEEVEFAEDSEITTISEKSFYKSSIKSILIPSQIKKIDEFAFFGCNLLETVNFANNSSLTSICLQAFAESKIRSITIPSTVQFISKKAFQNCISLKSVTFGADSRLTEISESLFEKTNLYEISIPSSVTKIGANAFKFCFRLQKVSISEESNLQSIGDDAFTSTTIESFYIPSNVSFIGSASLSAYGTLQTLKISQKNQNFMIFNDTFLLGKTDFESNEFDLLHVYIHNNDNEVTIPSFIKCISRYSFRRCQQIKSLVFSNDSKIELIENHAFYGSSIERIKIPYNVRIGENAFQNCNNLESIQFFNQNDNQMKKCVIADGLFKNCKKIKFFELLAEEITLGNEFFSNCNNVLVVSFPNASKILNDYEAFYFISENVSIFVKFDAEIKEPFSWNDIDFLE